MTGYYVLVLHKTDSFELVNQHFIADSPMEVIKYMQGHRDGDFVSLTKLLHEPQSYIVARTGEVVTLPPITLPEIDYDNWEYDNE